MALVALAALGDAAQAQGAQQDWPTKPIKIITGFAAGGIGDLGARLLADHITRTTGQQAVVENRTGAAGTLGMDAVAKAAPDGTTLGLVLNGNLVINPFIQKQMPFDAMKDLVPVAAIGDAPQMIALSTEVQAKTFKEFQALAKEKPGTYTYGSAGVGSLPHLSMAELARLAGLNLVHVPYRGNAPAMTDLLAGRIQLILRLDRHVPCRPRGREAAHPSDRDEEPVALFTGRAGLGRGGIARLSDERVDRRRRARRHSRTDARPHPCRDTGHDEGASREECHERRGARPDADEPRGIFRFRESGICAVGNHCEGRWRAEGMSKSPPS